MKLKIINLHHSNSRSPKEKKTISYLGDEQNYSTIPMCLYNIPVPDNLQKIKTSKPNYMQLKLNYFKNNSCEVIFREKGN